jgi:two-component system nitrogen regulation response regulator NtrX
MGAFDFVEKPLSLDKTVLVVGNAVRQRRLEAENRELRETVGRKQTIVGESYVMRQLLEQVAMAAPTNGRVLIYGENGTGKELVARTIASHSRRARGPFIEVNCAAIPEELIESELFGHMRGSFTGATADRRGKFELADGGTLFLDEIGDMSVKTQAKVLRALQEQVVEPVGGTTSVKVDVRVIAATNKDLPTEIRAGRFREDLYFRLNVIPILVPPLRERREDIPQLVQHFARLTGDEHNLKPKRFEPAAMEALQRYRWRGNIRELRNTIERVMIMSPGDVVRLEDLPLEVRSGDTAPRPVPMEVAAAPAAASAGAGAPASQPSSNASAGTGTLREFKDAAERAYLVQKLRENNWNISKTAEVIDTPRSNLYKKLEQYGIKQEIDG